MKTIILIAIFCLTSQAQAFKQVEAEGYATDCCFRVTGDIDLVIQASEDVKKNLQSACEAIYGISAKVDDRSQRIKLLDANFEAGGSSVLIEATATCRKK